MPARRRDQVLIEAHAFADETLHHLQFVRRRRTPIRARAGVPVVATVRDYWPVCYWCSC
jgi:hypothetical protein